MVYTQIAHFVILISLLGLVTCNISNDTLNGTFHNHSNPDINEPVGPIKQQKPMEDSPERELPLIKPSDPGSVQLSDKFNFASFDCGAVIISANREATGVNAILTNSIDSYMLNACTAKHKYFVVELCEDILVQTVVLGNLEYFSNTFRDFYIDVASKYPNSPNGWHRIGLFRAQNSRTPQIFQIQNPLIWARYIRYEQVSHYGNEHYCPINVFRVYGKTMMEDVKEDEESLLTETDDEAAASANPSRPATSEVGLVAFADDSDYLESIYSSAKGIGYSDFESDLLIILSEGESLAEGETPLTDSDREAIPMTPATPIMALFRRMFRRPTSEETKQPVKPATEATPTDLSLGNVTENVSPVATLSNSNISAQDSDYSKLPSNATAAAAFTTDATSTVATTVAPNPTPQQVAPPSPHDSIFKTMLKRIAQLEKNFSVSYKYLEEQSSLLGRIFKNWDSVQRKRFSTLVESFNSSLIALDHHHQMAVQGLRAEMNEIRRYLLHIPREASSAAPHSQDTSANVYSNLAVGLVILALYIGWTSWNSPQSTSAGRRPTMERVSTYSAQTQPEPSSLRSSVYEPEPVRSSVPKGLEPLNPSASPVFVECDNTDASNSASKFFEYQQSVLWASENDESVLMSTPAFPGKRDLLLNTADFLPNLEASASKAKKRTRVPSDALIDSNSGKDM